MADDMSKPYCLEIFCVRFGGVGYFERYLTSWEFISFQISPNIHCTVYEKLYKFLLLSA
jgi:hypothetical protein